MNSPNQWVLIKRLAEITGYSEDAIRHKVKNGTWVQGRIWRKAPEERTMFSCLFRMPLNAQLSTL